MIEYDTFQKDAISVIDLHQSLIVSAPTGAGKTVIAEYAIQKSQEQDQQVIYTSPIKALSNQKYRDFRALYGDKVGIVTGDVSINAQAPILVMTTEIYRNCLFEEQLRWDRLAYIIFDECHYIDDWERGTVWEEAIMFSPSQVQFLCLSATVPNIGELAEWIEKIRNQPIEVIVENKRPVPLTHRYQCNGKVLFTFGKLKEEFERLQVVGSSRSRGGYKGRRVSRRVIAKPNRLDHLINFLMEKDGLPAIYFCFGRRRVEYLAQETVSFDFLSGKHREQVTELFDTLCSEYGLSDDPGVTILRRLVSHGVAYHHAGMLPSLKEVVERLFTSKLIKLIFTTETFALGINMPARSVVFDELRKFYGVSFDNLRTRDYYQMAGRAGRRGMDKEGFVYCRINPRRISVNEIRRIVFGKTEEVTSQFNTSYATVLNLYRRYGEELVSIYNDSLHHFQSSRKRRKRGYRSLQTKLDLLKRMGYIDKGTLSCKGEFASNLYGYELLLGQMYEEGFLDSLDSVELCGVLAALIFEPRKGDRLPDLSKRMKDIKKQCDSVVRSVHKKEHDFGVYPYSKYLHFNLSLLIEAWAGGVDFSALMEESTVDEGEVVRNFRMVIQLLREIMHAVGASDGLQRRCREAATMINRDVVDAQNQLMH